MILANELARCIDCWVFLPTIVKNLQNSLEMSCGLLTALLSVINVDANEVLSVCLLIIGLRTCQVFLIPFLYDSIIFT